MWENFALSETADVSRISIVAVKGPDGADADYPTLRASDCKAVGVLNTSRSNWVASTMIDYWGVTPDYIGDGTSDQEELMTAICAGAGEGFGGVACDGVVSGTPQNTEVRLISGTYYVDGPVLLKDGIDLTGSFQLDDGELTQLESYVGDNSGYEGIIVADGVTGVEVSEIVVQSGLAEGEAVSGSFGSVCLDVTTSEGVDFEEVYLRDCATAGARFAESNLCTFDYGIGGGVTDGNMVVLEGVTNYSITRTSIDGMLISDSTNVVIEVGNDDEFGDPVGSIRPPDGGDQTANLVITGTSSGVVLKGIEVYNGAEPRILVESTSPVTLDAVTFRNAEAGECLVQVPQGSDESMVVQLNVDTLLELSDDSCFVLA
eukprot:jgi/Undpi1/5148/HiC_scaffold_19.g08499.m1